MGPEPDTILATIAFDAGTDFLTTQRRSLSFGRAAECGIRFAHQPTADTSVPRVAGAIRVIDERVAVDNLSDKLAFDIKTPGGPLETVRPGALLAPPDERFEIRYQGARDLYVVLVHRQAEPRPVPSTSSAVQSDDQPTRLTPDLSDRQWNVLAAYTDPLRDGRTSPATHHEVARRLNWSSATIRLECNAIWGAFKLAGVPMRDFRDKRDVVIDAAVRHHLVRSTPTDQQG